MATASDTIGRMGHAWNARAVVTFNGQRDTHIATGEDYATLTLADIFTMEPGEAPKGAGPAFIPSTYHDYDARSHQAQRERGQFVALCGDIDSGNHPLERIEELVRTFAGDAAWLIYSSAHARPGDMRWRVIIPLDTAIPYETWYDAQHAFFAYMEYAGVEMDRALDRAAQPVYLPNVPETYAKTGEPLRDDFDPLYYQRATTGLNAPGLRLAIGNVASGIEAIRRKRIEDDKARDALRAAAEARRRNAPTDDAPIMADFNAANDIATLLELYGYKQCPRNREDWRSKYQTGDTYATRIMGAKWVSLSSSDAAAGLGSQHAAGCYGDAYDLFVHYEHGGDHKAAFRTLYQERRASHPQPDRQTFYAREEEPEYDPETGMPYGDAPIGEEDATASEQCHDADALGFSITDWSSERFYGEAPEIEWLCENTIPQGVPALFAAMGGVGKSFIALDLALEIASAVAYGGGNRRILGGNVVARGSVVVLNAEDSKDSIHRRMERIDPDARRQQANGRVFVVPMPEVGGPMPLVTGDRGEFKRTAKFEALIGQLKRIPDLKLLIIDPLQAFVTADITKDPAAGQFMWSAFAQICAETGATVIACHHMRKEGMTRIDSSDTAREAIRGSTALIDGARATYALWAAAEDHARRLCEEMKVEYQPKRVVNGAVVKANDEHDWEVHTYVRADSGLLEDHTPVARVVRASGDGLADHQIAELFDEIDNRWRSGNPFSASAQASDRYLATFIQRRYGVSKKAAREQLEIWMAGLNLRSEMVDPHSKRMGLKVVSWPR